MTEQELKDLHRRNGNDFLRIKFLTHFPKNSIGAEVGVAQGGYTECILQVVQPEMLVLVDSWKHLPDYHDPNNVDDGEHEKRYQYVIKNFEHLDNVVVMRDLSTDAANKFPDEYFDWVYLDANHSYDALKQDIAAWTPKLVKGGLLAGHDYFEGSDCTKGVVKAVDELVQNNNLQLIKGEEKQFTSWAVQLT